MGSFGVEIASGQLTGGDPPYNKINPMTRSRLILFLLAAAATALAQQRAPIVQQLTFAPYHPTGIYSIGETVGWNVTPGPDYLTYTYKWTIRRNNNAVLKEGTLDLSHGQ